MKSNKFIFSHEPYLDNDEKKIFYEYLNNATNYLEFGSGGSTYQACIRDNIKSIHTVESDVQWVENIKLDSVINKCIKSQKLQIHCIDLNCKPRTFGHPNNITYDQYRDYPQIVNKLDMKSIDLIFIDGRFRVASALHCFNNISDTCIVIFDDLKYRPEYNIVLKYFKVITCIGKLVVLIKQCNKKAVEIIPDEIIKQYEIPSPTKRISSKNMELIKVNDVFDMVYVVNLDKDIEKYNILKNKLTLLNIKHQRFQAVDGLLINEEFNTFKELMNGKCLGYKPEIYGLYRHPGAYGILCSMIQLFKDAIEHGYKKILILQDDIYFHNDFIKQFDYYYNYLLKHNEWYMVWLGASQSNWNDIQFDNFYYRPSVNTCGAYSIGIDHLLFQEIIDNLEKRNYTADGVLNNTAQNYINKCYTLFPNLIIPDITKSSTGMGNRNLYKMSKFKHWNVKNYDMSTRYY